MTSKYQPVADYLIAHRDAEEIILTFGEIEAIIGATLPMAMRVDTSAWNSAHHVYVRAWEAVGWRARLDIKGRCVVFIRDAEEG